MAALFEKTRFDVEQEIMELYSFASIIQNYADMLYDGEYKQNEDDIHTTLSGFANLLISHSEKMMVTHCKHYELNQYAPPEKKAMHKEMGIDKFYHEIEKERGNVKDDFE
jgi:hypothetical protein